MIIVPLVLVAATLVARGLGVWKISALNSWAAATRAGLAAMFIFTGVAHFNSLRHELVKMVPPWVPYPMESIILTGVLEIMGAIGLLIPRTRKTAAVCLILFLIAVFPANAYAAQAGLLLGGKPATPLVPRLLLQLTFIGLTWWAGVVRRI